MKYNLNAIKCKTELKILRQYINIGNLIIITGTGMKVFLILCKITIIVLCTIKCEYLYVKFYFLLIRL